MNNFRYLKISNSKKIRYLTQYYKKKLYIVFLHGFMSDLEGKKPKAFINYCKKKKTWVPWVRIFRSWKILWKIH